MKFEVRADGPQEAPVLLFLHGYPDDHSLWNESIAHFSKTHRCLAVDFPNSGRKVTRRATTSFLEIANALEETVSAEIKPGRKVTVVCHDWGSVHAYNYTRLFPDRVEAIVALDVGGSFSKQKNPVGYALIPGYQLPLAAAYLATRLPVVGDAAARLVSRTVLSGLDVIGKKDTGEPLAGPSRVNPFTPLQNGPYFEFWKNMVSGRNPLRGRLPKIPVLFLYGTQGIKRYMQFHDDAWLRFVESTPGGHHEAFEGSGHWLMRDETTRYLATVEKFLRRKNA